MSDRYPCISVYPVLDDEEDQVPCADPTFQKFEATGDLDALSHAIASYDQEQSGPSPDFALLCSSRALVHRFIQLGSQDDLDLALQRSHLVLSQESLSVPLRREALIVLAAGLRADFDRTGERDTIEAAVSACREAVSLPNISVLRYACYLNHLGDNLRRRFWIYGDLDNLHESKERHATALSFSPSDHAERATSLYQLGTTLHILSIHLPSTDLADSCLPLLEEASVLWPARHILRANTLNTLAGARLDRFERYGDIAALDGAIEAQRTSRSLRRVGSPSYPMSLSNLAYAVSVRFDRFGDMADLDESIQLHREALTYHVSGNPSRFNTLTNLAGTLELRWQRFESPEDLDELLILWHEALDCCPPSHPFRWQALYGPGEARLIQSQRAGNPARLEEAISLLEESLSLLSENDTNRLLALASLTSAFQARFEFSRSAADLHHALELQTKAAELVPVESYTFPRVFLQLSQACRILFSSCRDDTSVILRAHDAAQAALSACPDGSPMRSACYFELAELHLIEDGPFFSVNAAIRNFLSAIAYDCADPRHRLRRAIELLPRIRHLTVVSDDNTINQLVLDAFIAVISVLPRVAYLGLSIQSRLEELKKAEMLAREGALHAIRMGQLEVAVEILEHGRSLFWMQSLQLRTPLDDLPEIYRNEIRQLARRLEHNSFRQVKSEPEIVSKADIEKDAMQRRRESDRLGVLINEVQALAGFEDFMRPARYSALCEAAANGPVVILVSGALACEALVVTADGSAAQIMLPDVNEDWLISQSQTWKDVTHVHRGSEDQSTSRDQRLRILRQRTGSDAEACQYRVLADLWKKVMAPVVDMITSQKCNWSLRGRLWLCPTGHFVFLPLHAAGIYPQGPRCADHIKISYIPTLGALRVARQQFLARARAKTKLIVAAVPHTTNLGGWTDLPLTAEEASIITSTVPTGFLLNGTEHANPNNEADDLATVDGLLGVLSQATILHLACHGSQDTESPLQSGFVMRDGMLTISRLMPLPLPDAFLAFLSACETAKGDPEQPDQNIHLAATMLFAGFKSVVATLWSMNDCDGPVVAKAFYKRLLAGQTRHMDPSDVPSALDDGIELLRQQGLPPSRWAPYVHIGL